MKVLLINPYLPKYKGFLTISSKSSYFPKSLSILVLAALTSKEHTVELQQGTHDGVDFNGDHDLVGISCITPTALLAYDIADEFRRRGKTVVLGGWHPSALPEEAKQHADSVVVGEAEELWPQLLKDFEKNQLKSYYKQDRIVDPQVIPIVDMFPEFSFQIQATRGCSTGCEFCCMTNAKFRNVFRYRAIENVIREINALPTQNFIFCDSSLTMNPNYTKSLFLKMKNLGKKFIAMGNLNVLSKDEELLRLAKKAGCIGWYIGFESIKQESIDEIGKKTNIVKDYHAAVKKIHNYNMMIIGSFVFGFDTDTSDIFESTYNFVDDVGIDVPDPLILTPFPGTPLYNRLKGEDRILTDNWSLYDLEHVVFKPKNMSPQELSDNVNNLYKRFFLRKNMLKRIFRSTQLGYYPFINVINQNYVSARRRYIQ
jgi:radical SAM superfamily enzyme YgiQ (UPF0313 family)